MGESNASLLIGLFTVTIVRCESDVHRNTTSTAAGRSAQPCVDNGHQR